MAVSDYVDPETNITVAEEIYNWWTSTCGWNEIGVQVCGPYEEPTCDPCFAECAPCQACVGIWEVPPCAECAPCQACEVCWNGEEGFDESDNSVTTGEDEAETTTETDVAEPTEETSVAETTEGSAAHPLTGHSRVLTLASSLGLALLVYYVQVMV